MTSRARLLIATAALTALALTACGSDGQFVADPGGGATASDSASAVATPSAAGTPADSPSPDPTGGADTVAVPVYFVGDGTGRQALYREFQQVPATDPLAEAAALVAGGPALDPDYRTLWPRGGFTSVVLDQETGRIVITLADGGSPDEAVQLTRRQATLAVQQMVYTLQGVSQTRDPLVVQTADGTPTSVFGIDTSGGVSNADELDVLGLVNVTTPEQGATVSGTFTATGLSSSFEGTTDWELRAGDGTVVKKGFTQAEGWMDKLYPWTTQVDLAGVAPGDYTFAALTDDPSGGTEGNGPSEDTKAITVR